MKFSKNDTLVVKGVAIIFLVFYHCLSTKDRLLGYPISFFPMTEYHAFYLFESMNVCVGMFAFLSAYGLMRTIAKKYPVLNARESMTFLSQRTGSLLLAFFIPYIICTGISLATAHNPYGSGLDFVLNMAADMLGLAGLLGTPMMVGTWWYMSFALVIIWLMPFTVNLYRKYGAGVLVPYLILPLLVKPDFYSGTALTNMTRWLLCIPFGIWFAEAEILEQMKAKTITHNRFLSKSVKLLIWTVILLLIFWLRKQGWVWQNAYYLISTVLPVVFIYWLYEFICDIPVIKTVLAFFGKHSSDIFFMHTFIRAVWLPDLTYSLGTWYAVFGFVMGVSLAMAVAAYWFRKLIRWDKLTALVLSKMTFLDTKSGA